MTVEKQKHDLEVAETNDESKKIVLKYLNEMYQKQVDVAISELEEKTSYKVKNEDGDEPQRIKKCIESMGSLIEQGLRIYSAIDAPKETKALFAPLDMKYISVDESVKVIEDKNK